MFLGQASLDKRKIYIHIVILHHKTNLAEQNQRNICKKERENKRKTRRMQMHK